MHYLNVKIYLKIFFYELGKTVEQLELITDTIYEVPTEGMITSEIVGTNNGRIFLASEDGNLFEIDYWVSTFNLLLFFFNNFTLNINAFIDEIA